MRVFWLNGGLHAEPDNPVEAEALLVLLEHLRYDVPPEREATTARPATTDGGSVERGGDLLL